MATADRIAQYVRRLPERLQAEVLDFVAFLLEKVERNGADSDRSEWSQFSLDSAMRDLETDGDPEYGESDLREVFS